MSRVYDVAVIGGGPAGYVAAIKAAQRGADIIIFEKDAFGGTCLNRGCIPTKTYLKTARLLEDMRKAGSRGIISDSDIRVSMPDVLKHKEMVVKQLGHGVRGLIKSNKIHMERGVAKLQSATQITCEGRGYQARNIILCSGAKPAKMRIPGIDNENVMTSDDILSISEIPARLCIIGGGVIGCEMAEIFTAFGSKVTIVELCDRLIPTMDCELSGSMHTSLEKKGINVLLGRKVEAFEQKSGSVSVELGDYTVNAGKVLVSTGRMADLECLGQLSGSIKTEHGKVCADSQMRTSIPNIYAPGDINGKLMLAHAAFHMGEIAAINATGGNETVKLSCVPISIYTSPEIASVGLTEQEAVNLCGQENLMIGRFPFSANGRSLASGQTEGFIKVIAEKRYGEILGVHIAGYYASELIQEAVCLISSEITVFEAGRMIHGHPTFSEAFVEACLDADGRSIHLPPK